MGVNEDEGGYVSPEIAAAQQGQRVELGKEIDIEPDPDPDDSYPVRVGQEIAEEE